MSDTYNYNRSDLGANYTKEQTTFRLWSPNAKEVFLYLHDKGYKSKPYEKIKLEPDEKGTWVCEVKEDLHGVYYTYEVHFENKSYEIVDPYAKACGINGERGMVVDLSRTSPKGWDQDVRPNLERSIDTILYETHIRDFTIHKSSGINDAGKFLGFTETHTESKEGLSTGIDHLAELGVTHLHLLPITDYAGINESKLDNAPYHWGYQPVNFFCLEGSYSTNPLDGETRIKEFKRLVQTLHQKGIRVTVDLVFDHVGELDESYLERSNPNYFYRKGNKNNQFPLASEKPMVRKFIVDVITYLAKEYHLDGFGIDNLGSLDQETIDEIRYALDAIDSSILLFGNTLSESSDQYAIQKFTRSDLDENPRVAIYNHDGRDAIKGPFLYREQPGFVNGGVDLEESIKFTVAGGIEHPEVDFTRVLYSKKSWANQPNQVINYASRHNDFTLYDKIIETTEGLDQEKREKMVKIASTLILTSQGIPFIQSGDEMLRSKNGDKNSVHSPDFINQIVWNSKYDHEGIFDYFKGLIALRKSHPAFRIPSATEITEHLSFIEPGVSNTLGVHLKNNANGDSYTDIIILYNANTSEVKFKLPHFGIWNVVVDGEKAGTKILSSFTDEQIVIPELTSMVLYSNEKMVKEVTVVNQGKESNTKKIAYVAGALGLYLLLRRRKRK